MEDQEYQELQEQLQGATQFIIEAAREIKDSQAAAEAYKALTDKVLDRVSRRPVAAIPEEEYNKIRAVVSSEIKNTVAKTRVPAPDMSQAASRIAAQICQEVSEQIGTEMSLRVSEAIKNKTARIDVHHEHHHTAMYGMYASSEENRKKMVSLFFVNIFLLAIIVIIVLHIRGVLYWRWLVVLLKFGM